MSIIVRILIIPLQIIPSTKYFIQKRRTANVCCMCMFVRNLVLPKGKVFLCQQILHLFELDFSTKQFDFMNSL